MFTGIIEGLGTVESIEHTNDSAAITIDAGPSSPTSNSAARWPSTESA
jgi:riboflavin synthase alpha subunit